MVDTATRTLVHYSLKLVSNKDLTEASPKFISKCVMFIKGLETVKAQYNDPISKKFHFLAYAIPSSTNADVITGFFKSAKYDYMPPLIEKDTLVERKSPKKKTEGELERTHFALRVFKGDVLLLLEQKKSGVSITKFVNYLNSYLSNVVTGHKVVAGLSIAGTFTSKLDDLARAVSVEIHVPHAIVTDTFSKTKISTKDVKEDAVITFSAKRSTSIKKMAVDYFKVMRSKSPDVDIHRIKVYGKSEGNSPTVLDTDQLKDRSTVIISLDINKQVDSDSMLGALRETIGGTG